MKTTHQEVLQYHYANVLMGQKLKEIGVLAEENTQRILMGYSIDMETLSIAAKSRGVSAETLMKLVRDQAISELPPMDEPTF